jgi:lysozyme family protein
MLFWDIIKSFFHKPVHEEDSEMENINTKNPDWAYLWSTCEVDSNRISEVSKICQKIIVNKAKYEAVESHTKVPWYLVAALHYREASLNFNTCLHNGDLLPGPTHHVPKGRGPFKSWEEAAIDALIFDNLHKMNFSDIPQCLKVAEHFNGIGYRNKGELSPYVWAATNHSDETGKYVADGHYDSSAIEKQLGVAAIFKGLVSELLKI